MGFSGAGVYGSAAKGIRRADGSVVGAMEPSPAARPRVAVAGASGFVGRALLPVLARDFDVVALTRDAAKAPAARAGVEWRGCDLFSLLDAERALAGADSAVYLVHSMMPSARLVQGSFEDLDLIAAGNFARAARAAGVRQVVYLGGLLPEDREGLSRHLRSRLEVEEALREGGVPVTTLRAGLVVGAGGSSFEVMTRLVRRLPAMVCPAWTATRTQPVALGDVVAAIRAVLGRSEALGATADLGGPEATTYLGMLRETARALGVRRLFLRVGLFTPRLSTLWVRLVTGAPGELVAPLVESLEHEMVARDRSLQLRLVGEGTPLAEALAGALAAPSAPSALARMRRRPAGRLVRSVQRLPLPPGWDAARAAREYPAWLPRALWPFLSVSAEGDRVAFRLRPLPTPLLVLELSAERSSTSRSLFYVRGGLLAAEGARGRLEFREAPGGRALLAAIHDFRPRLPWPVYVATQALVHLAVMRAFGRHLAARAPEAPEAVPVG